MSRPLILVIEDDAAIRRGLVDALAFGGYDVREAETGRSGLDIAVELSVDLVLLDVMLPGELSGFDVLDELHGTHPTLPVIMVTARGAEEDRVRGLRGGADDYVIKPFSATELLARVEAVLRRSPARPGDVRTLDACGRSIDLERREVRFADGDVRTLTERETEILRYLASARDRAVARDELLLHVWGLNPKGIETRTVDMQVARLREKLAPADGVANGDVICTVRGKGYMLADAVAGDRAVKSRGSWWLIFAGGALSLAAALGWITVEMLRLEAAESRARAEAAHQEAQRLALWRMDSWFAPLLATEAARPYFEYLPFYPQGRAYTRILNRIEPGEILTPSPLLSYRSPYFLLHFQVDAVGALTSPQAPTGNLRDLAEATALDSDRLAANEALLGQLGQVLAEGPGLDASILAAEARTCAVLALAPTEGDGPAAQKTFASSQLSSSAEAQRRAQSYNLAQTAQLDQEWVSGPPAGGAADAVEVGPFAPLWIREMGVDCPALGDELTECVMVVARQVRVGDAVHHQGILVGWPPLREELLTQIADLFPDARLRAVPDGVDAAEWSTRSLASLPVALAVAPPAVPAGGRGFTPTRLILAVAWILLVLAIGAAAVTLSSSIAFGERRSRFASAVTHELRTPLTTFRMYAEMLDEGIVSDEAQRKSYIRTLRDESDRLGHLVENVLAYARLEGGRATFAPTAVTLGALTERLRPSLERHAAAAGMTLEVRTNGAVGQELVLDADAVGQIVENLVENAGKYARDADDRTIHVDATVTGGRLRIDVRDHGRGVPPEHRRRIFTPFDRGARQHEGGTPGVGLGLAIAQGLARRLGGDLTLEDGSGATFRLEVPKGRA